MRDDVREFFRHWGENLYNAGYRAFEYVVFPLLMVALAAFFGLPTLVGIALIGGPTSELTDLLWRILPIQVLWVLGLGTGVDAYDKTWGEDA